MLIVDADGYIVGILLGRPEDEDWDDVIAEVTALMESVRDDGIKWGVFKESDFYQRRGNGSLSLNFGTSLGSGQQVSSCYSSAYSQPHFVTRSPACSHIPPPPAGSSGGSGATKALNVSLDFNRVCPI
jgi:hypothetical protein